MQKQLLAVLETPDTFLAKGRASQRAAGASGALQSGSVPRQSSHDGTAGSSL